jgi:hypothetical protein
MSFVVACGVACVGLSCRVLSKAVRAPLIHYARVTDPALHMSPRPSDALDHDLKRKDSSRVMNDALFLCNSPGREASKFTFTSVASRKRGEQRHVGYENFTA